MKPPVPPMGVRPYFKNKWATIYHSSCEDVPRFDYDLLLTDPPYGQSYRSNYGKNHDRIKGDDSLERVAVLLQVAFQGLRKGRHIYVFGPKELTKYLKIGPTCELVWDKTQGGMGNLEIPWGLSHENITFGVSVIQDNAEKGKKNNRGALSARLRKNSVLRSMNRTSGTGAYKHPTEKPVDILRQMIESSSMLGETVYDPFMGSGSTLVAALKEERLAVGCELEERYCEVAANRVRKL